MHQGECGVIIALYILAGCVGLLIGFALWCAIRLHIAEDSVQLNTRSLVGLNDSLIKGMGLSRDWMSEHENSIKRLERRVDDQRGGIERMWELEPLARRLRDQKVQRLEQRLEAHGRYLQMCTQVARGSAEHLQGRIDEHERQIRKLDRAGHRHPDMEKR
jgi:hypothetical protein